MLVPVQALAEGAVKLLDCNVMQVCDQAGSCRSDSARFTFRMEPVELEAGGAGEYKLMLNESATQMRALSDSGPFLWQSDRERNVLLASSESEWLWHRLILDAAARSEVRFLSCRFQQ